MPPNATNAKTTITPITIPMMTLRFIGSLQGFFKSHTTHQPLDGCRYSRAVELPEGSRMVV